MLAEHLCYSCNGFSEGWMSAALVASLRFTPYLRNTFPCVLGTLYVREIPVGRKERALIIRIYHVSREAFQIFKDSRTISLKLGLTPLFHPD